MAASSDFARGSQRLVGLLVGQPGGGGNLISGLFEHGEGLSFCQPAAVTEHRVYIGVRHPSIAVPHLQRNATPHRRPASDEKAANTVEVHGRPRLQYRGPLYTLADSCAPVCRRGFSPRVPAGCGHPPETYLRDMLKVSRPTQGKWVPYDATAEWTILEDVERL